MIKEFLHKVSGGMIVLLLVISSTHFVRAQDDKKPKLSGQSKMAREQSIRMLDNMQEILEEYYYDPKYRGMDLEKRVAAAKERVKTMEYNWQMFRVLAQLLMDFNDSHTSLTLPPRSDYFQYGFGTQMMGDDCIVTSVANESDAKKQGLEVGDQITMIGRFKPTRRDLWKMMYVLYRLDPAKTIDLTIKKPDGAEKQIKVNARTMTEKEFRAELKAKREKRKEREKNEPYKCKEISKELIACKLYSFSVEKNVIDKMMTAASKYPKLILDLRGNGGGYIIVEEYLLSHFFNKEVKVADMVTRKKTEKRVTKPVGNDEYKGEISVLVDSQSASAAEMTARVLQIEKRARVYGDVSGGKVMTSIWLPFENLVSAFADYAIIYAGMSVTVADVIMSDGSRLEDIGVIPDEPLIPSPMALVKRTDPVMAYVAQKMGAQLSPEDAGKFYFMVAKEEDLDDGRSEDK